MNFLEKNENNLYESIKNEVTKARQKVYTAVNFAMVETYWNIGKQIYKAQGENERAEYGSGLLKFLSENLQKNLGKDSQLEILIICVLFIYHFQIGTH